MITQVYVVYVKMKKSQLFNIIKETLLEEKKKGLDGKACWDGYKLQGTKMKGGKRVDNCVPIKEQEDQETESSNIILPTDKQIILQADTDEVERGLVVTWKSSGGYDVAYWLNEPSNIVPAELRGADTPSEDFNEHGESFGDIKHVWLGYHPELDDKEKMNESDLKKIKDIIKKTLEKEGGAAGLKPLKKATSMPTKDLEQTLDKMGNVKKHKHDDYILTPIEENLTIEEVLEMEVIDENITEAKYKGKTVKLNKPMRGDSKKFKVYVNSGKKNADGSIKVKKVNFGHGGTTAKKAGQKTMKIRKSNPKARSAFRARHNCDNPGPKTMARYWSCKKW